MTSIPAQRAHLRQAADDLEDWQRNLRRSADNAAKLVAEWTDEDIDAFPQFMAQLSPETVRAFHSQRPSRQAVTRR